MQGGSPLLLAVGTRAPLLLATLEVLTQGVGEPLGALLPLAHELGMRRATVRGRGVGAGIAAVALVTFLV